MSVSQRLLRNQGLRNLVPPRVKAMFAENRVRLARVSRHTELRNVYHCCLHKTGSQWIRKILADPDFLIETVPYYHDNPTYLPREARFGRTARFTKKAQMRIEVADLLATSRRIAADTREPVLILLAEPLDP